MQLDQRAPQLGVALREATLLALHLGDRGGQLTFALEHLGSVADAAPTSRLDFGTSFSHSTIGMGKPSEHAAGV